MRLRSRTENSIDRKEAALRDPLQPWVRRRLRVAEAKPKQIIEMLTPVAPIGRFAQQIGIGVGRSGLVHQLTRGELFRGERRARAHEQSGVARGGRDAGPAGEEIGNEHGAVDDRQRGHMVEVFVLPRRESTRQAGERSLALGKRRRDNEKPRARRDRLSGSAELGELRVIVAPGLADGPNAQREKDHRQGRKWRDEAALRRLEACGGNEEERQDGGQPDIGERASIQPMRHENRRAESRRQRELHLRRYGQRTTDTRRKPEGSAEYKKQAVEGKRYRSERGRGQCGISLEWQ